MSRYFFIRLDKMGDLISTLPVDQVSQLSEHEVTWITAQGLESIFRAAQPPRRQVSLSLKNRWQSFYTLFQLLRTQRPDATLFFYGPWWASLACFLAQVPVRAGRLSQWHHFLFLNKGIRQSRSLSDKHEADYNFDLIKSFLQLPLDLPTPYLSLQSPGNDILIKDLGLEKNNYYVVHPGMAGSALNWPIENWKSLIQQLVQKNKIVISGTSLDKLWLDQLRADFAHDPQVIWGENRFNILDLLVLLKNSKGNVAPSTGVIHLSASTGASTVGIYSPIKVQTPIRWGARGPRVSNIQPSVDCPAKNYCLKEKCPHYDCMRLITPEQVLSKLQWLDRESK